MAIRNSRARAFVFLTLFLPLIATAATVVDTGVPDPWPDAAGDPILDDSLWFGARFTLIERSQITDVHGYLSAGNGGPGGGTFTVALYSDGEDAPGAELFSASASAPALEFNDVGNPIPGWFGATGLDWVVDGASYWVTFEVRAGDTFNGFMANLAPHPLSQEVFGSTFAGWNIPGPGNGGFPNNIIGTRSAHRSGSCPAARRWYFSAGLAAAVASAPPDTGACQLE